MSVHWSRNFPLGENNCSRLFSRSATHTVPARSIAMPCGTWNCPGPSPGSPHERISRPSAVK